MSAIASTRLQELQQSDQGSRKRFSRARLTIIGAGNAANDDCHVHSASLHQSDCMDVLPLLSAGCVDLVLSDLPYGTTRCPWDCPIPLERMWAQLRRVGRRDCVYIFTAQQPLTWALCASNPADLRHELIWEKPNGTNPFQAKVMPMKKHENVLVFCEGRPLYNPQMEEGAPYRWNSRRTKGEAGGIDGMKDRPINNVGVRFPGSVLKFKQERGLHPTQKPVALMEWLIRTYSHPSSRVLDLTMGSGTTGVAALRTGRSFIGIERDLDYFRVSKARMLKEVRRA